MQRNQGPIGFKMRCSDDVVVFVKLWPNFGVWKRPLSICRFRRIFRIRFTKLPL